MQTQLQTHAETMKNTRKHASTLTSHSSSNTLHTQVHKHPSITQEKYTQRKHTQDGCDSGRRAGHSLITALPV